MGLPHGTTLYPMELWHPGTEAPRYQRQAPSILPQATGFYFPDCFSPHCRPDPDALPGFPGGTNGKEPDCQCRRHRDKVSIPGLGRSPGGGYSNPLQYSCLENPLDRRAWQATVYGVTRVGHDLATKSPTSFKLKIINFASHSSNFCFKLHPWT